VSRWVDGTFSDSLFYQLCLLRGFYHEATLRRIGSIRRQQQHAVKCGCADAAVKRVKGEGMLQRLSVECGCYG